MITKELIRQGIRVNVVKFVVDPNMESGTVCKIGENWFYFGGLAAEECSPEEYVECVPEEDIIQDIFEVLDDFRKDVWFKDEYDYYEAILSDV